MLMLLAALALSTSCSDATAPLNPALTGRWVEGTGIDTYAEFILEQRGSRVIGSFGGGVVQSPPLSSTPVRGTVSAGIVVLKWNWQGSSGSFTAALPAASSNELTGYMSYDGRRDDSPSTYHRSTGLVDDVVGDASGMSTSRSSFPPVRPR